MRHTDGFTLIEVLITITIMVVLLVLAVVSMSSSEVRARDEERATDMSVLAQQLENYYISGGDTSTVIGRYPGTTDIDTEAELTAVLRNIDPKVLRTPGIQTSSPMSLVVATTNSTAQAPTASQYIYQPLTSTGALCTVMSTGECRKYNIYYRVENTSTTQVIASKNQ